MFVRWVGAVCVGSLLVFSLWGSIWFFGVLLVGKWELDPSTETVRFELALWFVVGFFTIVRFLSYLDLRIRREGWEVELVVRAERTRLAPGLDRGPADRKRTPAERTAGDAHVPAATSLVEEDAV